MQKTVFYVLKGRLLQAVLPSLIITDVNVAQLDGTAITVDRPAILLVAVYAVCVSHVVVDVDHAHRIVSIHGHLVFVVGRSVKYVTVNSVNETLAGRAFLLEVDLAPAIALGIYYYGIIFLRVRATAERDAELVVSSLGVMYSAEEAEYEESGNLAATSDSHLQDDRATSEVRQTEDSGDTMLQRALQRAMTPASALAFMVFVLLYFPCIATFVAIKQEAGGWKWAIGSAVYTVILAWVMAFIVYRIALLF